MKCWRCEWTSKIWKCHLAIVWSYYFLFCVSTYKKSNTQMSCLRAGLFYQKRWGQIKHLHSLRYMSFVIDNFQSLWLIHIVRRKLFMSSMFCVPPQGIIICFGFNLFLCIHITEKIVTIKTLTTFNHVNSIF